MIAVFDDLPSHCPRCGSEITFKGATGPGNRREAMRGVAQVCLSCGLKWAVLSKYAIVMACDKDGSDLVAYAD